MPDNKKNIVKRETKAIMKEERGNRKKIKS